MGKIPKIILIGAVCIGIHCSRNYQKECNQKLSVSLISQIEESDDGDRSFDVIILLSDTSAIAAEFTMLTISNSAVAHGHLTKSQLFALCRKSSVLSIDRSKKFFPK